MAESVEIWGAEALEIAGQYLQATAAIEEMFAVALPRTDQHPWEEDGVGSCSVPKNGLQSELGLKGPALPFLRYLREKRDLETLGESTKTGCPYHRGDGGCVLGNTKSPMCIGHFDNPDEWQNRFGIDTTPVRKDVERTLDVILDRRALNKPDILQGFMGRIQAVKERVEQEPKLGNLDKLSK